ncbi:GDSL-type esterase/lipase family protein [Sporomusa sphaeroides]|uniref:GDSL-like Lipase/Acylhydrolase n=1 Tax=Sporomusa sphaeroides DSM 2875 TaxID=1337886 RepID=A0ABM9W5X0_9FIRM|nr:GDSL-type esterase/lipase family protein [Sporomusa sphaeroides]OLS55218.1 GDSL-like lipase/acylhydrolase [Sporomusa sphaeroides DSM 2875]CVK20444.1 GDSL-like Lipase/Acylhydrolase [Sporomusa sphaeroides DSM 2875]
MRLVKIIAIMASIVFFTITTTAQAGKIQLLWPNAVDAVMYELEIAGIAVREDTPAPQEQVFYTATNVYTPGVELDLALFEQQDLEKLYYRVRPLDLEKKPVGTFTRSVALSRAELNPGKPTVTTLFSGHPVPLYPVYAWIPVLGAARYEIEVTDRLPEMQNGTEPSRYRVRSYSMGPGFDFYDTEPFTQDGRYYWRVIALDQDDQALGTYSEAVPFSIDTGRYQWAIYGDSITHGGGAVSNPPSDARFDYSYYLSVPVKNLGKSGDTAEALVERFEAEVLPFKPKYLLILGGTNSIRGGAAAKEVIDSLKAIKKKCRKNGIKPIFLTLPPLNPDRIQQVFNQDTAANWQQELAKVNAFIKTQPDYIDIYSVLVDENGLLPVKYAQDGLHPDIAGKRLMGQAVNAYISHFAGY